MMSFTFPNRDDHRQSMHYHTTDRVGGYRHVHASLAELESYLKATGREMMDVTNCYDPRCLEEEAR
jgi:hypothetical protein